MNLEESPQLIRLSPLSIPLFRKKVEDLPSFDSKIVSKFSYLTGGRVNEVATKGTQEFLPRKIVDRQSKQTRVEIRPSTAPMGPKRSDVVFEQFEGVDCIRITMTILKRHLKDHPEIRFPRSVVLPLSETYDPWVKELVGYIQTLGMDEGIIPYNRRDISGMITGAGFTPQTLYGAPPSLRMENILRHLRIAHLQADYGFRDEELRHYFGWSYTAPGGSATQLNYETLNPHVYFPKLLKPLPSLNSPA